MSKTYIDTEGLEQELSVFEASLKNIKDIFQKERNNLRIMNDGHSWVGKSQEIMYSKQMEFQQNFEPVEEALQVFIDFIKKSIDDYKRLEDNRNNNLDNNSDSLDVN